MSDDFDGIVHENDRNASLLLAVAIQAYAIEFGEPFNVQSQIVDDIISSNIATGKSIPMLSFLNDENDGRLKIGVTMHTPEELNLLEDEED